MLEREPVAVVVGATGGIGRAVVDVLAGHYTLCLAGRNEAALKTMAAATPDAFHWTVDLATPESTGTVPGELATVDLLVHCAGVFEREMIRDMPENRWRELFAVNLFGVAEVTRNLLPGLRAARGRVIMVNSTVVTGSPAGRSAYAASKQALRVFTEALHREELAHGVRVTSIYPGRVATEMQRTVRRVEGGRFEPDHYLAPETVASAIFSILSAPADAHLTEFVLHPTWRTE